MLRLPPNFNSYFEYERPRKGNWAYEVEVEAFSGGLAGNDKVGYSVNVEPTYFVSDAFNVYRRRCMRDRTPDWLVWQRDNLIGSFDGREMHFDAGFNWTIGSKQELRVKLQAIGLKARLRQAYRVDPGGNAVADRRAGRRLQRAQPRLPDPLSLRARAAVLSICGVWPRRLRPGPDRRGRRAAAARQLQLRDDEQLLVKLSYRFEDRLAPYIEVSPAGGPRSPTPGIAATWPQPNDFQQKAGLPRRRSRRARQLGLRRLGSLHILRALSPGTKVSSD